jgi:hypothetical protein
MAEDKKSFVLYCDQIHLFEGLDDDEAGRLIKHIFRYCNDMNPVAPDKITKVGFEPIKHQLKRDLIKYLGKKKQWSDAGKASAETKRLLKLEQERSTKSTDVDFVQRTSTDSTVNVTVNDNVTVNVNDIYFKDLPNSRNFETISMQTGLSKDYLISMIPIFKPKARVNYPNFNEFCDHFKSWVLKNNNTNPSKTRNQLSNK